MYGCGRGGEGGGGWDDGDGGAGGWDWDNMGAVSDIEGFRGRRVKGKGRG